jgi:hypothetical protein
MYLGCVVGLVLHVEEIWNYEANIRSDNPLGTALSADIRPGSESDAEI